MSPGSLAAIKASNGDDGDRAGDIGDAVVTPTTVPAGQPQGCLVWYHRTPRLALEPRIEHPKKGCWPGYVLTVAPVSIANIPIVPTISINRQSASAQSLPQQLLQQRPQLRNRDRLVEVH